MSTRKVCKKSGKLCKKVRQPETHMAQLYGIPFKEPDLLS